MVAFEKEYAPIPMRKIGPVSIKGSEFEGEVMVPLATFESPLWPSTNRGARVTRLAGGIYATLVDDRMSRSVVMEAPNAGKALEAMEGIRNRRREIEKVIRESSRFARLVDYHYRIVANLIFFRIEITTGEASGHNMVTKAAEFVMNWLLTEYPFLRYISISGNYCTDKKTSSVNAILGRGKNVIAEVTLPRDICEKHLRTTPEKIAELNVKKNLIGTLIAGGVQTANAHFANMLLGFYLATGQDAANIIEGSQGITHAEVVGGNLYFSVTVPNLIIGTVGSGKHSDWVKKNLALLRCDASAQEGTAHRLAIIAGSVILCGELSLLAAQTNPGELVRSHEKLERLNGDYS